MSISLVVDDDVVYRHDAHYWEFLAVVIQHEQRRSDKINNLLVCCPNWHIQLNVDDVRAAIALRYYRYSGAVRWRADDLGDVIHPLIVDICAVEEIMNLR